MKYLSEENANSFLKCNFKDNSIYWDDGNGGVLRYRFYPEKVLTSTSKTTTRTTTTTMTTTRSTTTKSKTFLHTSKIETYYLYNSSKRKF